MDKNNKRRRWLQFEISEDVNGTRYEEKQMWKYTKGTVFMTSTWILENRRKNGYTERYEASVIRLGFVNIENKVCP